MNPSAASAVTGPFSGIRAVLLDVDNTLLDFDLCAEDSARRTAASFGFSLPGDFPVQFKRINDGLWRLIEQGVMTKKDLFRVRWDKVFTEIGCEPGLRVGGQNFEEAFQKQLDCSAIPVEGALALLDSLKGRYPLYVATNGPLGQQSYRLELAGMLDTVGGRDHIFASEEIGISKPEKGFFDACMRSLRLDLGEDLQTGEILMIGDSLTADIGGAADYGMATLWFDHDGKGKDSPGAKKATVRVDSLGEIPAFLN